MLGVNRKEEKATSKILKKNYLDALRKVQKLEAEKSQLATRNIFLESENKNLKELNEELTQENNSLTEKIYG